MGQESAAFFDLDRTILTISSGRLFVRYLRQARLLTPLQEAKLWYWAGLYLIGRLDFPHLMARLMVDVVNRDEAATRGLCQRWFDEMAVMHISEDAREALARHRAAGDRVVIITASAAPLAEPVAAHLPVDALLATQLEARGGRFTGQVVEPPCHRAGKVFWAEWYAKRHGVDLAHSYFYTDGVHDVPLLSRVGHPRVVNPDRRLRRIARARGWPILSFR